MQSLFFPDSGRWFSDCEDPNLDPNLDVHSCIACYGTSWPKMAQAFPTEKKLDQRWTI
jgi:hypothetical protein